MDAGDNRERMKREREVVVEFFFFFFFDDSVHSFFRSSLASVLSKSTQASNAPLFPSLSLPTFLSPSRSHLRRREWKISLR